MSEKAKRAMDFAKHFRLDGDLIRCQICGRGIHISNRLHSLHHAHECSNLCKYPWDYLDSVLASEPKPPSDPQREGSETDSSDWKNNLNARIKRAAYLLGREPENEEKFYIIKAFYEEKLTAAREALEEWNRILEWLKMDRYINGYLSVEAETLEKIGEILTRLNDHE